MTPKEKKNQPSKHSYFTDNITKKKITKIAALSIFGIVSDITWIQ
jgi:hypothetical protein